MASEAPKRNCSPYALVFLAAALYVLITGFRYISPILLAFILVLLVALALNPLVAGLRQLLGGRSSATALVISILLIIFGLAAWGVYRPVKASMSTFIQRLPDYWERIQRPLLRIEQKAAVSEAKLQREVHTEIKEETLRTNAPPAERQAITATQPEQAPERSAADRQNGFIRSSLAQLLGGVAGSFRAIAANALTIFMIAITVFVGVVFTLLNPRPIVAFLFSLVPEKHHPTALRVGGKITKMIPRWALATILGMSVVGLLVFFAMWMVLGFQDALLLGMIAFVLEAVPYIGPILAVVPAVLLGIGHGGLTPLWVVLAYIVVQLIENNLIMPVIVAGRLRLHPVAALFAILISVTLFGVLGVLLAVPLVAIMDILHQELYRPRFTPNVTDEKFDQMAQIALNRKTEEPREARRTNDNDKTKSPNDESTSDK